MTTAVAQTYDNLVSSVEAYLERTDAATIAYIPTFIMLAEQVLAAELKFLGNINVGSVTLIPTQAVLQKPARWHKTVSMTMIVNGERTPIFLRKYEYLREYWPSTTATDEPKYYADYDYTHWLIAPTPDAAYSMEVVYYERVQPLDSTNQTNWFTQYAPQAMLYGTLLQAMPFLKNDERMQMWQAQYTQIVTTLKEEDKQRVGDRQAVALDS
jgi:hypothetical protein